MSYAEMRGKVKTTALPKIAEYDNPNLA